MSRHHLAGAEADCRLPTADQIALARRLVDEGRSPGEAARILNVHASTLYRAHLRYSLPNVWFPVSDRTCVGFLFLYSRNPDDDRDYWKPM